MEFSRPDNQAVLPSLEHLTLADFEEVYEPSEDTFLLCDALEQDHETIRVTRPERALEIGCGSGCVITFFGQLTKRLDVKCKLFATDVNAKALDASRRTAEANNVEISFSQVDLLGEDAPVDNSVDVLLFNPPYVPTPPEEVGGTSIEASWAGGLHGREVINRFLPILPHLMKKVTGVCYLVLVEENKPEEIKGILRGMNLAGDICLRKRARNEALQIMKIVWAASEEEEVGVGEEDSTLKKDQYVKL